jgi:HD-like signal output (HDOD) protein
MQNTTLRSTSDLQFEFVQSLAADLSNHRIELPSFPKIAARVRHVLSNPNSSLEQLVRVIGSEPALSARLMRIANASSFNRSGRPAADLRTAIKRIGYQMVRSASMAFALSQMRRNAGCEHLQRRMHTLWQRSAWVGAFAYVLARTGSRVNPDEALLAGMMHGIGKLYIMTRAVNHADLFADDIMLDSITHDWHPSIGKAILENWEFSDVMAAAVGDQDGPGRNGRFVPDLRDVLAVAILMAIYRSDIPGLELALTGLPAGLRLGLDETRIRTVMQDCAVEVHALSDALIS